MRGVCHGSGLLPSGPGAQVGVPGLAAQQAEEFDGPAVGWAEPVRHRGVEFRCLARGEHEVVLAEDHPDPALTPRSNQASAYSQARSVT